MFLPIFVVVEQFLLQLFNVEAVCHNFQVELNRLRVVTKFFVNERACLQLFKLETRLQAVFHRVEVVFHDLFDFRGNTTRLEDANETNVHA